MPRKEFLLTEILQVFVNYLRMPWEKNQTTLHSCLPLLMVKIYVCIVSKANRLVSWGKTNRHRFESEFFDAVKRGLSAKLLAQFEPINHVTQVMAFKHNPNCFTKPFVQYSDFLFCPSKKIVPISPSKRFNKYRKNMRLLTWNSLTRRFYIGDLPVAALIDVTKVLLK